MDAGPSQLATEGYSRQACGRSATGGVAVAWRRTRVRSARVFRKNWAVGRVGMPPWEVRFAADIKGKPSKHPAG